MIESFLIVFYMLGGFVQKGYIDYGTSGPNGRVLLDDFNRNGKTDIIFTGYSDTLALGMIFERQNNGTYLMVDTIGFYLAVWDAGDFDSDGLYDIVTDGDYFIGIMIFESPDSFSYPNQEVWRDTVGPPLVLPICVYDIDQDGLPEIVKNRATPYGYLGIYEAVGDNQYDLIFADNPDTLGYEAPAATIAFGDFDLDDKIEFVPAGGDEWYWIYESQANNTYEKVNEGQLPTLNIRDCFSVPDADGDGKLEFVVKGAIAPPGSRIQPFIFEATGDNTYEIIKSFDLFGGSNGYYGGYSDAGDVDGDGIPEIVLEGCQNVYLIKSAGNDSFYVWDTLSGNASGSNIRVTNDIDQNGYNEIVISGNNQTRIYEYDPGGIEETALRPTPDAGRLQVYPNPFLKNLTIKYQSASGGPNPNDQTNPKPQNPNPDLATCYSLLATLKIYDATGRLVRLWDYETIRLSDKVTWSGDDESGNEIPEGVYFVYLKSRDFSVIRKVIKLGG